MRTQNPPTARSWGFDPPPPGTTDSKRFIRKTASPKREAVFVGGCFGGCWVTLQAWERLQIR